jgi:glycosyltransferase involved in cell wall biosynthesis
VNSHDIAVVLTAHAEGRLLVPTLRSLEVAIGRAAEAGLAVQLVIVMDRIDQETRRVLDAHLFASESSVADVIRLDVDNGDLGASRNDGIAQCSARFIAIMDGDNLISSNWLVDGVETLSSHTGPAIAHVELIVSFGDRRTLWTQLASTDPSFDPSLLAVVNYWDSSAIAGREVFEAVPYPVLPPGDGYGPEDWAWNLATVHAGIDHIQIPQAAMFYRARRGSLLTAHGANLLPQSGFLSDPVRGRVYGDSAAFEPEPSLSRRFGGSLPATVQRPLSIAQRATRSVLRPWIHGARRVAGRISPRRPAAVPAWLWPEWREANLLEPAVPFLRAETFDSYHLWGSPWSDWERERAAAYWRILAKLGGAVDYLFVAPWVKTGGGDRVLLQYIDAVRRIEPDARVALITTEKDASTRLSDLDEDVIVVEMRDYMSVRVDREWLVSRLLPQLLTQCPPRTMHLFNSTVGYDVVERYGRLLARTTSIFLSTFVMDRTPDGERTSVLFYRHSRFLDPINGVLVDSNAFIDAMVAENGYAREKFLLQRQIVPELPAVSTRRRSFSAKAPMRLLWAGRFDLQKRLDVLSRVAWALRERRLPVEIHFFGEVVMGDPSLDATLASLAAAGAVRHPPYKHISDLGLSEFDAYVMTSEWEGVPNSLLELMSSGLPVIVPMVGGVPEVVDDEVGFPVERFDDVTGYVDAVEAIMRDPAAAERRAGAARIRVHERFSKEAFDRSLREIPHYVGGLKSAPSQDDAALADEALRAQSVEDATAPSVTFAADAVTRDFLASEHPRTYLFSGSGGYSNFGDILQAKNVITQWRRVAPHVEPVVFFHVGSLVAEERLGQLRRWYGVEHIVFFAEPHEEIPSAIAPVVDATVPSPVHVLGGGYLNSTWGPLYLDVIGQIGTQFAGDEYVFSGMQFDQFIIDHLQAFIDEKKTVRALGVRDEQSLALTRRVFGDLASPSFDDLIEIFDEWGRERRTRERGEGRFRLGLHVNASDYVGGDAVVSEIRGYLDAVLASYPDAELVLVNAYTDRRPEVRDSLAALRLFGEDFPFSRFEVVDIARVALETEIAAGGVPEPIRELELDAAITCSYHTALLMNALQVPAFLLRHNEYYRQKAALFDLPSEFETFLAAPADHLADFTSQRRERAQWNDRIVPWMAGGEFPPARGADR